MPSSGVTSGLACRLVLCSTDNDSAVMDCTHLCSGRIYQCLRSLHKWLRNDLELTNLKELSGGFSLACADELSRSRKSLASFEIMVLGSCSHCQACDNILHQFPGAEVWYPLLLVVKIHVEGSGIESHSYRTWQDNDCLNHALAYVAFILCK